MYIILVQYFAQYAEINKIYRKLIDDGNSLSIKFQS